MDSLENRIEPFCEPPNFAVYKSWENFFVLGEAPLEVPHYIRESWAESKKLAVDPLLSQFSCVDAKEFERHRIIHQRLLHLSQNMLQQLKQWFAMENDILVILSSPNGIILDVGGEMGAVEKAQEISIVPGAKFAIEAAGTNGLAEARRSRAPALVQKSQHYCSVLHSWSCFSFPIRGGTLGECVGILDVTAYRNVFHPHTMAALLAMGRAVELAYRHEELMDQMLLSEQRHELLNRYRGSQVQTVYSSQDPLTPMTCTDPSIRSALEDAILQTPSVQAAYTGLGTPVDVVLGPEHVTVYTSWRLGQLIGQLVVRCPDKIAKNPDSKKNSPLRIIGHAPNFLSSLKIADAVAQSQSTVLITGESGTGKDVLAQYIHQQSHRTGPYVAVNCGSIPPDLMASELFGYEEGAFSGAKRGGRKGYFEEAQGGSLFLDEIGEMPIEVQVHLLRVLEEYRIRRLGGNRDVSVDVRVIAATNLDLEDAIRDKTFRRDLYYRLNVVRIALPALRDRGSLDIRDLAKYFLERAMADTNTYLTFTPDTWRLIQNYSWPGNIRQLKNAVERLAVLAASNGIVTPDDLVTMCPELSLATYPSVALRETTETSTNRQSFLHEVRDDISQQELKALIRRHNGNISAVARELKVARSTVYRRMARLFDGSAQRL